VEIRRFKPKDKKVVSELYYELHPIEEKEGKEKGLVIPLQSSKIKNILFVAEDNRKIIGFILSNLISYGDFKYGSIDEFFVKKTFRGKGIGTSLLKKAIKELEKLNPKLILVGTEKANKEAIKMYQKVGFKVGKESLWFYWHPKKKC